LRRGKESFVFLGCTIRKKRSIQRNPRMHFMQRWPSPKAMKRVRERVHEMTDSRHSGKDVKQIIATLNPVLRGWGNYFRTGNAERKFNQLDSYVWSRLVRWMYRRGGQRPGRFEKWSHERFVGMGLYQLRGTVKYPAQATSVRSSLSRVRENRTHGLKGGVWKRAGASWYRARLLSMADVAPGFQRLMTWMGGDDSAPERLDLVRRKLAFYFRRRGFGVDAEDLAQEVLMIAAEKCAGEAMPPYDLPEKLFFGIANVLSKQRYAKRQMSEYRVNPVKRGGFRPEQADSDERRCLDPCLKQLSPEKSSLLLKYVGADEWERAALAQRSGIPRGDLSVRVFRIKRGLADCIRACVKRSQSVV
jgi:DNA-directed RNA polymerase specialized sigma24 family protein